MGKLQFSQCRMMNIPLHTGDEFGILLRRKKNATISARETNRTKKPMSTTAQTYWQSSAEIWDRQRNYSQKNEVHKDAISCFSIRRDWRFAVRAKSFALHWRSRGFFWGHVRSCEKGLWPSSLIVVWAYPKTRCKRSALSTQLKSQLQLQTDITNIECNCIRYKEFEQRKRIKLFDDFSVRAYRFDFAPRRRPRARSM